MREHRVHLTGASGAGVSTLGRALARRLDAAWFDTDDFYWVWGVEPYTLKREVADRLELLGRVLDGAPRWVLSGSLVSWGDPLLARFTAVVFVQTPTPVRLQRLRARELARFGEDVLEGGRRRREHLDFLDWAARYDAGGEEVRSRAMHERWLARLSCPVLRTDGERPPEALADALAAELGSA
jgi:adenylate kinase family enzyme